MSKTQLNQIAPADLVADFGVDGFRYHFLRDTPFGPDGDFSYEGMVARYNADLANNLGNLLARVATVVGSKCGGVGPAPRPDSPLAAGRGRARTTDAAAAWDNVQPSIALEATWRLIRATNAHLEANEPWKAEPGPAVDGVLGDALEALRIVAVLASPAIPARRAEIWRRIGLAGLADRPAAARRGGVGRVPGRSRGGEGRAALPAHHRLTATGPMRWTDNHCHLPDDVSGGRRCSWRRPGGRRRAADHRRHRR